MLRFSETFRTLALHIFGGAALGILILHPVTMVVYWFEFGSEILGAENLKDFMLMRISDSFSSHMLAMSGIFALLGGCLGVFSGLYYNALLKRDKKMRYLRNELGRDIKRLIESGENEFIEFKSSIRWDYRLNKINKALEEVILKTVAGFLNNRGGNLLVGFSDSGDVIGLDQDYKSLKQKNRDGYEQYIMTMVKNRLGGHICSLIHVLFEEIDGSDVCRIIVEPSQKPVYLADGRTMRYFLRTGNSTNELNLQESISHIESRKAL